jgi:ketosteroid isomerase-like protein
LNRKYLLLLFLTILFSCTDEIRPPVETLNSVIEADNRGDIEAVLAHYTDDAILMPPGKAMISGKEAIRKNYATIFESSALQLYPVIEEIIQSDKLTVIRGAVRGSVTAKSNKAITPVNDKFLMVLSKRSSAWKISRLIWSRNE